MGKKAKKKKNKGRGPQARPLLSLCLIARDEAAFLECCLRSVRGLVDEIVVVDTGSEDDTPRVAHRHGARVFKEGWRDDFARARNRSLEQARGEWVLVLDCDEVLSTGDHDRLRALLRTGGCDAYRLSTRNYTQRDNGAGWVPCRGEYPEEKQYGGYFPTTKVRLWRRRPEIRFEGAVHELVEPALERVGARVGDCPVPVHHYGYAEKERAADRYLKAGEEKLRANPEDLQARYELAIAYRDAGKGSQALDCIDAVLAGLGAGRGQGYPYLSEEFAHLVRADVLTRLDRAAEALEVYDAVLARFPGSYQAFNNKGLILERMGRVEEALACYERGVRAAPDNRVLGENLARLQGSGGGQGRLSVCLIARDEEAVLGRCLKSVRSLADEIILVDTGSRDRTVEIARQYGAKIGHFEWCDDFARARNESLRLAGGEWILWLDADDYLLPEEAEKVARLKRGPADRAYYFTLVNEGADRSRFRQLKMFPNRSEIRFSRPVHETVEPALKELALPAEDGGVQVCHTGYADPEVTRRKRRYYLRLMEEYLATHPGDRSLRFRVGHTYYTEGERSVARRIFTALAEQGGTDATGRLALVFGGRCLLEDGEYERATEVLAQALALKDDDALALMSMGDACTKRGRHEQAVGFLERARRGQVDPYFPLDARLLSYSLHFFLGQSLAALGRRAEAEQAFVEAGRQLPERQEAGRALAQLRGQAPAESGLYARPDEGRGEEGPGVEEGRLTLCMIVRDEEQRLGRCLDSVQGLVDEIVVVDTGSRDRTVEIARQYGAKIGHFEWCDDFARARNESLRLAGGEWILWLDADDILPGEYHAQIRHLLGRGRDKSYFFVLDDRGYEQVSCLQMRLFPNLPGVEFEMPIHEQVTPSLTRLGVEMVPTQIRVVHTGYATPEIVRAKKDRYLAIMERWLQEHPQNYIVRSHVALTYHTTGRLDEAEEAYLHIIEKTTCRQDRNWVVYTTALLFLGRTYLKKGELEKARDWMRQAEEIDPEYLLTRLSQAELHMRLKDFEKALAYARAALECGRQMTFFPIDYPEVRYSAQVLEGQALQALERWSEAEAAFRRAADLPVPRRSEALGSLSEMLKVLGERERARQVLEQAQALDPERLQHLFNLGVLHLEDRQLERAEACFRQVVEREPDFAPALLNLGYIAKVRGQPEEAERIYRRAVESESEGVEARANLGHLLLETERFAEARDVFEVVIEKQKGLLDIELGLLFALAQQGDLARVRALVGALAAPFPELVRMPDDLDDRGKTAGLLVRLGAVLVRRQLYKCAEFALGAAVSLDPGLMEARRGLAEVHIAQGNFWKAVTQFEAVLSARPRDGAVFRRLGDCYEKLGAADAARLCYERSRQVAGG